MKSIIYIGALLLTSTSLFASSDSPSYTSSYLGEENRAIKSLSADDIKQLQQGKGWGLAKAAELNGMPGPAHLLQMKKEIALSPDQETQIRALFDDMETKAIPLGNKLIALEKNLNDAFASKSMSVDQLQQQLDEIAQVQKQLRFVHLVTHLQTPHILQPEQIAQYNRLRGYASANPCDSIPTGHDAAMWKQHNGCK